MLIVRTTAIGIYVCVFWTTSLRDNACGRTMGPWTAYFSCSMTLNILMTGLIAYPIIKIRHQMQRIGHVSSFSVQSSTSVLSILIESALPFTVFGSLSIILSGSSISSALGETCHISQALWMSAVVSSLRFELQEQSVDKA